jgi:hypothetical protein
MEATSFGTLEVLGPIHCRIRNTSHIPTSTASAPAYLIFIPFLARLSPHDNSLEKEKGACAPFRTLVYSDRYAAFCGTNWPMTR